MIAASRSRAVNSGHMRRREHELGIRAFPEQEVAEPLLAARANQQVHVGHASGAWAAGGHCLGESSHA